MPHARMRFSNIPYTPAVQSLKLSAPRPSQPNAGNRGRTSAALRAEGLAPELELVDGHRFVVGDGELCCSASVALRLWPHESISDAASQISELRKVRFRSLLRSCFHPTAPL